MKKQWFRLPALVVALGMLSSAIIVFAKGNSKSEEIAPIPTVQKVSIEVEKEIIQETPTPTIEPETEVEEVTSSQYPEFSYSKDWDYEDSYLLAKIAMAEAEGENIQTKTLVILTVLNRVHSDEFPDTIYDVIFNTIRKAMCISLAQLCQVVAGGQLNRMRIVGKRSRL